MTSRAPRRACGSGPSAAPAGIAASAAVVAIVGIVGWLAVAGRAASAADRFEIAVRPGGVVRWQIDGLESCGRGARTWPARGGTCWFAIDLLEPKGLFEVFGVRSGSRETAVIRVTAYPYPEQRLTLQDSSRVDLAPEDIARVRREQARVKALWSLDGTARFRLPLGPPLEELGAAGSFGSRRYFNDQPRSPHSGADFAAAEGVAVRSVAPGTVVLAADLFFSGQSVFVDHGDGLISMYFHLSSMSVAAGDELEQGGVVGRVGQTGRATGPHLHFGLRWRGARVDPSLLLGPLAAIPSIGASGAPVAPDGA